MHEIYKIYKTYRNYLPFRIPTPHLPVNAKGGVLILHTASLRT